MCTVNTYLNSRFGLLGIGAAFYQSLPTLVLGLLQMSNYFTYGLSNLATILMSLNRLTAITMPLRYNQVCHKIAIRTKLRDCTYSRQCADQIPQKVTQFLPPPNESQISISSCRHEEFSKPGLPTTLAYGELKQFFGDLLMILSRLFNNY